jgi:hypothetical protein
LVNAYYWKEGIDVLTKMFNKIQNGREFPSYWKTVIMLPVYEGKEKWEELSNYRIISLLLICDKICSDLGWLTEGLCIQQ